MLIPHTEIIVTQGGAEILRRTVPPGDYVLGRAVECDVVFEAELVSRRHAQLTIEEDQAFVQDLGSSHGTSVNGQPVTKITRLWPNQKIQVGSATVELRRVRMGSAADVSLAPVQAAVQRLLPEELLRDKKYDIGGVVAQGGMGTILNAREAAMDRTVAMKVMLDTSSVDNLARFVAEAKVTGSLEHPNIVPVHELSVDENGQPFYTMKMVRGITLKKVLELLSEGTVATVKKYPLSALLTVYQKLCDAVAFAHSKGIIHRDLKPENVMLGDFGEVLVMDWGLGKRMKDEGGRMKKSEPSAVGNENLSARSEASSSFRLHPSSFPSATLAGTIMGTPQYMSPEQARGEVEDLDVRSDIYALGTILYQILALRPAVTGRTAMEVVSKVAEGRVEPLVAAIHDRRTKGDGHRPPLKHLPGGTIPGSLAAVVGKAMAFERDQRYWAVEELQADLTAYQNGFATSAENASLARQMLLALRRHKVAAAGIVAVLIVGVTFGTKALVEGRRAEREAVRAKQALADLKKSAPALLKLGENEADAQHFAEARRDIEAALALDPALLAADWRLGSVLLAQERFPESLAALKLAAERDPTDRRHAGLIPLVEKMAAAAEGERHSLEIVRPVYDQLMADGALGEALAFLPYLQLAKNARFKLVSERLEKWLGKSPGNNVSPACHFTPLLAVEVNDLRIGSFDPLRNLPIESLGAGNCGVSSLEALRGMPLQALFVNRNPVTDLRPLAGMPLRVLNLGSTPVSDLRALHGLPLEDLNLEACAAITELGPLAGLPLQRLFLSGATAVRDFSALRGMPLVRLIVIDTRFSDCGVLTGMPLAELVANRAAVRDIGPLVGLPLHTLDVFDCPINDLTPLARIPTLESLSVHVPVEKLLFLRHHPGLKYLRIERGPLRPVAEIWAAYDEHQKAGAK